MSGDDGTTQNVGIPDIVGMPKTGGPGDGPTAFLPVRGGFTGEGLVLRLRIAAATGYADLMAELDRRLDAFAKDAHWEVDLDVDEVAAVSDGNFVYSHYEAEVVARMTEPPAGAGLEPGFLKNLGLEP